MNREHWGNFDALCIETFEQCTLQPELIRACGGHADIARVLFHHCLDHSIQWLHARVPALEDARPFDLIASGSADRVRDCLLRFP